MDLPGHDDVQDDVHYDVAVVGYGPTGATTANLLGRAGLRVLVLERDGSVHARPRAVSTDEDVLRIWQRAGLADRLERDMLSGLPLDFVDARGRPFLSLTPASRGAGYPTQLFLHQPAVEEVLRDGVARYAGVDVRLQHEVLRVDDRGDHVEIIARADGARHRWTASYVVAADGGSSPVRSRLGVGFAGTTYEDRWVVIDTRVRVPWPDVDRLRFHCDPQRPAVDCPTPLGHHRWEFPVLPGEDEAELTSDEGVWQLLHGHGITRDDVEVLRAVVYSHHVRSAERWRVGRVFLAGDAAHVMPPWIGQGMSAGVRDAGNLSWKLAAVVHGELPETVLDSYEAERQPHVRAISAASVFFGRVICERNRRLVAVRDPLFRLAMRAPLLGDHLRSAGWFPAAVYPQGFHAASRPPGPLLRVAALRRTASGRGLPQPWVLTGDGSRTRLDDALGQRWTVLSTGQSTEHAWAAAGADALRVLPTGAQPRAGALVDIDDVLLAWLSDHRAARVAARPDGYVYAAGGTGRPLPAPPAGLRQRPATARARA